jgi:hypothetical protein
VRGRGESQSKESDLVDGSQDGVWRGERGHLEDEIVVRAELRERDRLGALKTWDPSHGGNLGGVVRRQILQGDGADLLSGPANHKHLLATVHDLRQRSG